jgi:hypothetical protein
MMELFKKHGIPAGIATVLVLAITFVPIYYQYKTTVAQNIRITALETAIAKPVK